MYFKTFLLVYAVSFAARYYMYYRKGSAVVLPGDYYIVKAPKRIFIPFGSAFFMAVLGFGLLLAIRNFFR